MIDELLSRLERVREGHRGNWTARCPAHEDRGPSLSIAERDGKILLHCFAGCEVDNIVGAVGLSLEDLFPPREAQPDYLQRAPKLRPSALELLRVVALEAGFVAVCAADMARGVQLGTLDLARLQTATGRLQYAVEVAEGR